MELSFQNPWWEGKQDPHLQKWEKMQIKWVPEWTGKISLEPLSLNFVVGPRQTVKTTGIKMIAEKLSKKDPYSVIYLNLELMGSLDSFSKFFSMAIEHKKKEGIESLYLFLDEVTHLPGWWKILKGHMDAGLLEQDVITATSSSSLKIKGDAELFA